MGNPLNIPLHIAREALADPDAREGMIEILGDLSQASIKKLGVLVFDIISLGEPRPKAKDFRRMIELRPEWIERINPSSNTPLMQVILNGHLDLVDVLLEAGAKTDIKNSAGLGILDIAAISEADTQAQESLGNKLLAARKFSTTEMDTALYYAANYGNLGMVRSLLAHGAGFSVMVEDDATTLSAAAYLVEDKHSSVEIVCALLKHPQADALINEGWGNKGHKTPLHRAALKGNVEIMKVLLEAGACVDPPPHLTSAPLPTPLMFAACGLKADAMGLLIKSGCDPHRVDPAGQNTLHYLAEFSDVQPERLRNPVLAKCVDMLAKAGVDFLQKNLDGKTPHDIATKQPGRL